LVRFTNREAFTKYMASHPEAFQALVSVLVFRLRQADEVWLPQPSCQSRSARRALALHSSRGLGAGPGPGVNQLSTGRAPGGNPI